MNKINRENAFTFSRLKGPLIKSLRDLMKLAGLTQTMRFIFLYHAFMARIVLKCIIWVNIKVLCFVIFLSFLWLANGNFLTTVEAGNVRASNIMSGDIGVDNIRPGNIGAEGSEDGYYYVIVTVSEFASACEPIRDLRSFDDQHQAKIITLDEIPSEEAGNPTYTEIMTYFLNTLYPHPPEGLGTKYILLVGDSEFVPHFGHDSSIDTDMLLASYKIAIGRLPANNITDIDNYYQKILAGGSSGAIIPDGRDNALFYLHGELCLNPEYVKREWEPYINVSST